MDDKSMQLIERLAEKLGTTAEFIMGVYVDQAFLSGISTCFIIGMFFLISMICLIGSYKFREDGELSGNCFVVSGSACAIAVFGTILNINSLLACFF